MDGCNNEYDYESNYYEYEWKNEPRKKKQIVCENPDIYNLNLKEMNQLIYNQLEEVKSILNCIYDVVKEGEK